MLLKDMQPCCSPAFNHATAPTAQQVRSQEEARLMKSVVSRVHLILEVVIAPSKDSVQYYCLPAFVGPGP